jgi:hypothetical protein
LAKNNKKPAQNKQEYRYHIFATMAGVDGNRTHHGRIAPATGFEVQEAHQEPNYSPIIEKP